MATNESPESAPDQFAIGQTVQPDYRVRSMPVYPLNESDLGLLTKTTIRVTIAVSLGTAAFTFAGSIFLTGVAQAGNLTPEATVLLDWGIPITLVLGVVFYGWALLEGFLGHSELKRIKRECKDSAEIVYPTAPPGTAKS